MNREPTTKQRIAEATAPIDRRTARAFPSSASSFWYEVARRDLRKARETIARGPLKGEPAWLPWALALRWILNAEWHRDVARDARRGIVR